MAAEQTGWLHKAMDRSSVPTSSLTIGGFVVVASLLWAGATSRDSVSTARVPAPVTPAATAGSEVPEEPSTTDGEVDGLVADTTGAPGAAFPDQVAVVALTAVHTGDWGPVPRVRGAVQVTVEPVSQLVTVDNAQPLGDDGTWLADVDLDGDGPLDPFTGEILVAEIAGRFYLEEILGGP